MKRLTSALALCAIAAAVGLVPSGTALAGTASDVPELLFAVRSVSLDGYTGNIRVRIRVKCTQPVPGVGTASWSASAVQDLTAEGRAEITCDGIRRRSTIVLDPRDGRFHPGSVGIDLQTIAWGSTSGIAEGRSFITVV